MSTAEGRWLEGLDERTEQDRMAAPPIPGNTDPWAGPVDPDAVERELVKWQRSRNTRAAQREQEPCGCWMRDCAECMARLSDGQRPTPGSTRAAALRSDALLQQAKELAARAVMP